MYKTDALSHRILDGPLIPQRRITAMKHADDFLYFALDNGTVMIQNLMTNDGNDFMTFDIQHELIQNGATITQILPIGVIRDTPTSIALLIHLTEVLHSKV